MSRPDPHTYVGRRIAGRFVLERPLGTGGAGMVFEARQEDLGRNVAIKILRAELEDDADMLARFRREARAAAALSHPHIAQVLDFAEPRGGEPAFIAFELARGQSLLDLVSSEGRLPAARAVKLVRQVLAGLSAAHEAGIVHRDLKPANVFVADVAGVGETAKILDFGIAQIKEGVTFKRLTATGVIVGTPRYMSPEQVNGARVDARTDVWAAGVMLYRLLTGAMPFEGTTGELIGAIRERPTPPMPADAGVPSALEAVVARALEKSPDARWQSAAEMSAALEQALSPRAVPPTMPSGLDKPRVEPANSIRPTFPDPPPRSPPRSPGTSAATLTYGVLGSVLAVSLGAGSVALYLAMTSPRLPPPGPASPSVPAPSPVAPWPAPPPALPRAPLPPLPSSGTLLAYLDYAELRAAPLGDFHVASVRAVAVDGETSVLDLDDPSTMLAIELAAPDGRCLRHDIGPSHFQAVVPSSGCGAALARPLPDVLRVLEVAAEVCPRFLLPEEPLVVAFGADVAGTSVTIETASLATVVHATTDPSSFVIVDRGSCNADHRPTRPSPLPPGLPRPPDRNEGGGDGVINPWGD